MIEDLNARAHQLLDTLTFADSQVAVSSLATLSRAGLGQGSFTSLLGIELVAQGDGTAVTRLRLESHLLNRIGTLHGGVACTLADVTTGLAASSAFPPGLRIVTQDLHQRFHGMVAHGEITAEARVVHLGSRTVVVHCTLRDGERLLGTVDATFALLAEGEGPSP